MISNNTGYGLKKLWGTLNSTVEVVGGPKVSNVLKEAENIIEQEKKKGKGKVFLKMEEMKGLIKESKIREEIEEHEAWDELMELMHNTGTAVVNPSVTTICLDVGALAKMMSAFIAPEHHIRRLVGGNDTQQKTDIISEKEAISRLSRIKKITEILHTKDTREMEEQFKESLQFMEQCSLCFRLNSEEEKVY